MNKFCPFTYKFPVYGNTLNVCVFTKMGFKRRPQGSYHKFSLFPNCVFILADNSLPLMCIFNISL